MKKWVFVAFVLLGIYLPLLINLYSSLPLEWRILLDRPSIVEAFYRSLVVATSSATLATLLGFLICAATSGARLRDFYNRFLRVPIAAPEIVLGISFLMWFSTLGMELGMVAMVLAHTTFVGSYVILVIRNQLERLDPMLLLVAQDLGANRMQTFLRVTLPLSVPAIVSGWMLAFTLSMDDFLVSLFTSGAGADTLPIKIYTMIRFGVGPEPRILASVIFLTTLMIVTVGFSVWSRWDYRRARSLTI